MDGLMDSPGTLLALWERAVSLSPRQRDDVLLRALAPPGQPPPKVLGARNRGLLELHAAMFGPRLAMRSGCPACGSEVEFACAVAALTFDHAVTDTDTHELRHADHAVRFRLPDADDLDAAADADDEAGFVESLLQRCVLASGKDNGALVTCDLPDEVRTALADRMESLDPGASLEFALTCPACGHAWSAPLDIGTLLWQRLQDSAERLLTTVDRLAHRYGWREAEILAMSPTRRAAYLQLGAA